MANINFIAPFFIVADIETSLTFYTGKLGFKLQFQDPDNSFFAMIIRENALLMLKAIAEDIKPQPNRTRHEWARWDAYIGVNDPDALFEEFTAKGVTFSQSLLNDGGLRGFEILDADGYVLFFGRTVE